MANIKIKKIDESNLAISTEDSGIHYELKEQFSFFVPGYRFMPKFKARIWDGKLSVYDLRTKTLLGGLYDEFQKFCKRNDYSYEIIDSEYGSPDDKNSLSEKHLIEYIEYCKLPENIKQRKHQLEAILKAINSQRCVILSPTASGKSLIIYIIARYLWEVFNIRTLLCVPTVALVEQMFTDFFEYGYNVDKYVHTIYSGKEKFVKKPITISTWQSVYKLDKEYFEQFGSVLIDECFSGDTNVLTENGWKPISHITKGEIIKNINSNGEIKTDKVVKVHNNISAGNIMYKLTFDEGTILEVTGNHKLMLSDKSWKRVDELTEMDELFCVEEKDH